MPKSWRFARLTRSRIVPARRLRHLHYLRTLPDVLSAAITGRAGARSTSGTARDASGRRFDRRVIYQQLASAREKQNPLGGTQKSIVGMSREEALACFRE